MAIHAWLKNWLLPLCLASMLVAPAITKAAEVEALGRNAVSSQAGPKSYLLDLARAGKRIVAAGERGLVLLSDDEGSVWRQVIVPVSVTLTAVGFADDQNGFIVGHGGSVLKTTDSGEGWSLMLDGRSIAEMVLSAAQSSADEEQIAYAERLVADGPDKPLLDLLVVDDQQIIVVGAYGLVLKTEDGGQNWTSLIEQIDNPIGLHIYSIRQRENRILMAGEQGAVWLSQDNGETFEVVITPYEGSFFTADLVGSNDIVLAGLRGNAWRSEDNGASWNQMIAPNPATINASIQNDSGKLLMVNQAGMVLSVEGDQLVSITRKPLPPLNSILALDNGGYLMASQRGLVSATAEDLQ